MKNLALSFLPIIGLAKNKQLCSIINIENIPYTEIDKIKTESYYYTLFATIGFFILGFYTTSLARTVCLALAISVNCILYTDYKACRNKTANKLTILLFGLLIYLMALNDRIPAIVGILIFTILHVGLPEKSANWRLIIILVALIALIF